ncbi:hypothetical protein CDV31_000809 [Fusarium ambrosium]|uniref:Helicase C-terminal domain-containing protein n=1 Tax=Fusarium ambrosium TaxID=131363 RepID=A0A428V189_9HYPO|nr:hypothetical protein CDV31_000809 [Fusarium ambrosium]
MPPKRPGSPSTAGPSDVKRQMTSEDADTDLPLAITIADEDFDTPLRHLPAPISDGSSLRPVEIRPIPVTNNRATLTKEQWKAGTPWPKGSKRAYFCESACFNRPQTTQPENLEDLVRQHEAKKNSRLSGVTFLNPYDDSKLTWLAGLVGFDNTHQLNTWLDRDVARVVIAKEFPRLYNFHPYLHARLNREPGVLIVRGGLVKPQELETVTCQQVDKNLSCIVTMYRLLTSFPQRFPEHPDDANRKIWEFTHNNWQAAFCVLKAFKKRRSGDMKSDKSRSERNNLNAVWYGTDTEQSSVELADMNSLTPAAQNAVDDMKFAQSHEGCMDASGSELVTLASADEIISRCPELARKYRITPGQGLQDIQCALGCTITECIVEVLFKLSSSPHISNHIFERTHSRIPLTSSQKSTLISFLLALAKVHGNTTSSTSTSVPASDITSLLNSALRDTITQTNYEMRAQEEDTSAGEDEDVTGSELDTDDAQGNDKMEQVRQLVQLINTLSPEQENLDFICQQIGIPDWRNLRMSCMDPDAPAAKPRQIVGAWWIYQRLTSPLRAAILADECGIGKTLQIGLALAIDCFRTGQAIVEGTRNIAPGERNFKPSVIFCPGVVVPQTFRELRKWFGPFFDIRVAYGNHMNRPDPAMNPFILNNAEEVKAWVDECERGQENPMTMRKILLTSYPTAVFRMVYRDKSKLINREDLPQLVDEEENRAEGNMSSHDPSWTDPTIHEELPDQNGQEKVQHDPVRLSIPNAQFNFIICDEGHLVKNPNSLTHKLIKTLHHDALLIVSATPILNHVKDFDGYINLMWRHFWGFKYKGTSEPKAEVFYDNDAWEAVKRGEPGQPLTMELCLNGNGDETLPDAALPRAQRLRAEYMDFVRSGEGPLFRLNPSLFQAFAKDVGDDAAVAEKAIKPLLEMICLRRGMSSKLTLPDGTIISPDDEMPALSPRLVQLRQSGAEQQRVSALTKKHIDDLLIGSRDKHGKHIGHTVVQSKRRIRVNTDILRTLALLTTHPKFYLLTQANMRNTKLLSMMAARQLFEDKFKEKKPEEFTDADREKLKKLASDAKSATKALVEEPKRVYGGVDEVNTLVKNDRTRGLQWFFYLTRSDGSAIMPKDRLDMASMICYGSPKLAWTVQQVLRLNDEGKRVLIYVNHPLTLMILNALLTYLGIRSLHIRSAHPMAERIKAIQAFNDPNEDVGALISTFQLNGFGVNLHEACHHEIIVEYPHNLSTVLHGFGRLWRLGQTNRVEAVILYQRNSFDAYQLARMARKHAPILAAEGYIPSEIQGKNRLICAYEIISMFLGLTSNWYSRVGVPWQNMDDEDVEKQGQFYSALARFMMADPGSSVKVTGENIEAVALSWAPGHQLTVDHIDGKLPPLENGVVLGSLDDHETEASGDGGEEFEHGVDDIDVNGEVMVDDEGEGVAGGSVSGNFKIAMVGRVVIDPEEASAALSTA